MARLQRGCSREAFLGRAGLGVAAAAFGSEALAAGTQAWGAQPSTALPMGARNPADALEKLQAGNTRVADAIPRSGPQSARLLELASGQDPFAVVLGCSDSRVPIETVFDQIPGNVFVVRVAGNFLNADNFGSIEYALTALRAKLIVVLGHTECGAVAAACEQVRTGSTQPGHIGSVVNAIVPAAHATRDLPGDWLANAIERNVRNNMKAMTSGSRIIADAVEAGNVSVSGGIYVLHTGRIAFL